MYKKGLALKRRHAQAHIQENTHSRKHIHGNARTRAYKHAHSATLNGGQCTPKHTHTKTPKNKK